MRILIEVCLTICEWIQEKSILRAARKAAREGEKKTILSFLSQGAVGGAFGFFVLSIYFVIAYPSGYNFVSLVGMPVYLVMGALSGSFGAVFVWLPGAVLMRKLHFIPRAMIAMVVVPLPTFAFLYYLADPREMAQLSHYWWLGFSCTVGLPVGFMTGSSIRPVRAIIFGAGRRMGHRDVGSWLSIPFGFLLRAASVFGLLEALMVLALWISNRSVDQDWFPVREHLPSIVFAILYFATTAYFSFNPPRKRLLLPTSIGLLLPLTVWILKLRTNGSEDAAVLAYMMLGFICLKTVYVFGRLITPEPHRRVVNSVVATCGAQKTTGFQYNVQL